VLDETNYRIVELLTAHQGCLAARLKLVEKQFGPNGYESDYSALTLDLLNRSREIDNIITTLTS